MGEFVSINKLEFIKNKGSFQVWQAVDVSSTDASVALSVAMGTDIKTISDIDSKSTKFLIKEVLNKNQNAKLIVIDLSKFPLVICGIDKRDQRQLHKNSNDKFSNDVLQELDSKEPGIPVIIVNVNIPFTGLKRVPINDS